MNCPDRAYVAGIKAMDGRISISAHGDQPGEYTVKLLLREETLAIVSVAFFRLAMIRASPSDSLFKAGSEHVDRSRSARIHDRE